MKKLFMLAAVLGSASTAFASNPERLVCDNGNSSTIVVIEQVQDLDKLEGDEIASVSMLIVKLDDEKIGDRIPLVGSKGESAKGDYYDLTGPDGYGFFVSAPASKSRSELKLGKRVVELDCE